MANLNICIPSNMFSSSAQNHHMGMCAREAHPKTVKTMPALFLPKKHPKRGQVSSKKKRPRHTSPATPPATERRQGAARPRRSAAGAAVRGTSHASAAQRWTPATHRATMGTLPWKLTARDGKVWLFGTLLSASRYIKKQRNQQRPETKKPRNKTNKQRRQARKKGRKEEKQASEQSQQTKQASKASKQSKASRQSKQASKAKQAKAKQANKHANKQSKQGKQSKQSKASKAKQASQAKPSQAKPSQAKQSKQASKQAHTHTHTHTS